VHLVDRVCNLSDGDVAMSLFLLFLSGTCSAIASILLRLAGRMAAGAISVDGTVAGIGALFDSLMTRPMLFRLFAMGAYVAGFLFYALALRKIELSIAYPLMVGVTLLEIFVFGVVSGESLTLRTFAGAGLLLAGILLLYSSGTPR